MSVPAWRLLAGLSAWRLRTELPAWRPFHGGDSLASPVAGTAAATAP